VTPPLNQHTSTAVSLNIMLTAKPKCYMQDGNRNNVKFPINFEGSHVQITNCTADFIKQNNIFIIEATIRLLIRNTPFS
jgi:hypothetical protein